MGIRSLTRIEAERRARLIAVERYDVDVDLTALPDGPEVRAVSTVAFTCREPGAETWPNQGAMEHGGGMTWLPGTYDPELNLLYWGTGNPNPVYAGQGRKGTNLWTCSIVALNPDTGKLV